MEIVLFKRDEIKFEYFKDQEIYRYTKGNLKKLEYGNYIDLDRTKCKIDLLDKNLEKIRRAAVKYLHEYELVKVLCKKSVISRAYFKLYEIIYFEPIILLPELNCLMLCEAPGGFIECIVDIRRKKNLRTSYISISKQDAEIKYDNYLEENNLFYGDITDPKVINETIFNVLQKFPQGLDVITADGGFDIKLFNGQEIISSKLLLCEMFIALSTQKIGGTFIIKFFDMFTHNSIVFYLLLCSFYESVKIIKPKTSRNCNSERYLVCSNFHKTDVKIMNNLLVIIKKMKIDFENDVQTLVYPNFNFNILPNFSKKICSFNNLIVHEQIKIINESIKMVYNKDTYFQNLLLKIFLEKFNHSLIVSYKHILCSRIKKSINFLKMHNINTHQIVYRLF